MKVICYFNDPPGKRWSNINSVVTDLREKYGFDLEVIKKKDMSLRKKLSMLRLPAVEIDGEVIAQGRDITIEELEREITSRTS